MRHDCFERWLPSQRVLVHFCVDLVKLRVQDTRRLSYSFDVDGTIVRGVRQALTKRLVFSKRFLMFLTVLRVNVVVSHTRRGGVLDLVPVVDDPRVHGERVQRRVVHLVFNWIRVVAHCVKSTRRSKQVVDDSSSTFRRQP